MENDLLKEARESISSFCMNECKAACCKKGFLVFSSEREALNVFPKGNHEIDSWGFVRVFLNPCTLLKDNKCTIHKNNFRPLLCKEFPIFQKGNNIFFALFCPAVKNKMFEYYILKLSEQGYNIKFQ